MPAGDPIFAGITAGTPPVLQPGAEFSRRQFGIDDGRRSFLVHPDLPQSAWPQVGDADTTHQLMFVVSVRPRGTESTLRELLVDYRGITADEKPPRLRPDTDVQMISVPLYSGGTQTAQVPIPMPTCDVERVTGTAPNNSGVGVPVSGDLGFSLPAPPDFSLSFFPAPGTLPVRNYFTGWVLQSRAPEEIVKDKIWLIRERYVYYYSLSV